MANLKIALLQMVSCGMDQRAHAAAQNDGRSVAFGADGGLILQADEQEGVHLAEFDLERLGAWRKKEVVRNQQRKPRSHRLITSDSVCGTDRELAARRDG